MIRRDSGLPAGTSTIQVTATGDTTPVIEADLEFAGGTSTTIAAYGLLADISAAVFTDDTAIADGQAKLRAIHLSPSAPASVDIAVQGGDVVVPGLAYPEASGSLTLEANTNYTAFAMDATDGVQVIAAVDAQGTGEAPTTPNTALGQPTSSLPLLLAGVALLGLALAVSSRTPALPRTR